MLALLQITPVALPGPLQVAAFCPPAFFLIRAAMEALNIGVAAQVVISGSAMRDTRLPRGLQEADHLNPLHHLYAARDS